MKKLFFPLMLTAVLFSCSVMHRTKVTAIQWSTAAVLPAAGGDAPSIGVAGPFTGVHEDVLFVAGGANFPDGMPWDGGTKKYHNDGFVFRKQPDGKLQLLSQRFHLPEQVAYGASCPLPAGLLCAGGETPKGLTKKTYLLQWNNEESEVTIEPLPDLPAPLANASIARAGNKVYLAGGETTGAVSSALFVLDVNNVKSGWKSYPPLPKPVSHAVMVAQSNGMDSSLYFIGGRKRNEHGISSLYASVFAYDIKAGTWTEKRPLPHPLSAATGVAYDKNEILVFSGDKGETFHQVETVVAEMNATKDEQKKHQLDLKRIELLSGHPGFTREILRYNTLTNKWDIADRLPFEGQVTTTAIKWGDDIIIPSGEIRAGVRTPRIIIGKARLGIRN